MSSDEAFILDVLNAIQAAGLEAVIVGSVAGLLQGAPIVTDDLDLLIRDTPKNREKIREVERRLSSSAVELSPATRTLRLATPRAHLDLLFDEISGGLSFEALRSRAVLLQLGDLTAVVARLEDVIASKEAAGRPKDVAQLPVLRDTLRVLRELGRGNNPADLEPPGNRMATKKDSSET